MGSMHMECTEDHINNTTVEDSHVVKPRGELMYGDVIWVRIRGTLWWPAQVVDGKTVSRDNKPRKKLPNDILVRLYGTYSHLYRDPEKHTSEFEKILEQNNGRYQETFRKALEQDISQKKPVQLKRTICEPREAVLETPNGKKVKRDAKNKTTDHLINSPGSVTPSKVSSEMRRVKVMQNLGLVAPPGSPFQKTVCAEE
ncbi:hypothetical protein ACHQM5_016250 [Ranunculus cassubicifolius]